MSFVVLATENRFLMLQTFIICKYTKQNTNIKAFMKII